MANRCFFIRYVFGGVWILGTLLACAFGVITALALEHVEATNAGEEKH